MKNKLLVCASMLALVTAFFTSCKDKTDLYAIDAQLAENSILRTPDGSSKYYVFVNVDSATMSTTLHEWKLEKTASGRVGYYRVASTGNGLNGDVVDSLVWDEATMAEDGLSMKIPVTLRSGTKKELKWHDGVISVDGYTTTMNLISMASVLRTVETKTADLDFVYNDTTLYLTSYEDTLYYLAWKTEFVYFTQDSIDYYKQYLIDNADTLAWFNATYPSKAVPDTVRFAPNPETSGVHKDQYAGIIPRSFETMDVKTVYVNHGPLQITNSEIILKREGTVNTGSYVYHMRSWTKEFYDDPTSEKAESTDYKVQINSALWTPAEYATIKKFVVSLKGDRQQILIDTKAGEVINEKDSTIANGFETLSFAGFSLEDGEAVINSFPYKLKQ